MPAKFTNIIPLQGFELVAAKIFEILVLEIPNQYTLTSEEAFNISNIELERIIPVNVGDYPLLSVRYVSSTPDNIDSTGRGLYTNTYIIDLYQSAPTTSTDLADKIVSQKIQRCLGAIRAILFSELYTGLDLRTYVRNISMSGINMTQPEDNLDTKTVGYGQMVLSVQTYETSQKFTAEIINKWFTSVKLDESEDGYTFESTIIDGIKGAIDYVIGAALL